MLNKTLTSQKLYYMAAFAEFSFSDTNKGSFLQHLHYIFSLWSETWVHNLYNQWHTLIPDADFQQHGCSVSVYISKQDP